MILDIITLAVLIGILFILSVGGQIWLHTENDKGIGKALVVGSLVTCFFVGNATGSLFLNIFGG